MRCPQARVGDVQGTSRRICCQQMSPCVILASHRQTVKQEARIALAPVSSLEVLIDERAGGHFLVRDNSLSPSCSSP